MAQNLIRRTLTIGWLISFVIGCESAGKYAAPMAPPAADASPAELKGLEVQREAPRASAFAPVAVTATPAADTSTAAAPAPAANAAIQAESAARVVIYSAALSLVVPDVARAQQAIQTTAQTQGGYLQEMDSGSITVRVPAGRFQGALAAMEKLGEVTQRRIKSQDITEEMRDLTIRLDNAEQTRRRLLELIEKSQKVEDTVKIERELERVTETVELLKGKIRYYQSQVAFSTIKVELNSPLAQQQAVRQIPFAWVRELGDGLLGGGVAQQPRDPSWTEHGPHLQLPKSFIRYYADEDSTQAMSGEDVFIKVQRHENYKGGDLEFWWALARRALVENRAVAVDQQPEVTLANKARGRMLIGKRDLGGKSYGYVLGLVAGKHEVWAFEAWGPAAAFDARRADLEMSLRSMEAKR